MTTIPSDVFYAVRRRLASFDPSVDAYDLRAIVDTIVNEHGGDVTGVSDAGFLQLLGRNQIECKTGLPCPDWCTRGHGHPFEIGFAGGRQGRGHETRLPRPDTAGEVCLTLEQEDTRDAGDDSTAVRAIPEVALSFALDATFKADELRKLAASLLDAADKLDRITGAHGRTANTMATTDHHTPAPAHTTWCANQSPEHVPGADTGGCCSLERETSSGVTVSVSYLDRDGLFLFLKSIAAPLTVAQLREVAVAIVDMLVTVDPTAVHRGRRRHRALCEALRIGYHAGYRDAAALPGD